MIDQFNKNYEGDTEESFGLATSCLMTIHAVSKSSPSKYWLLTKSSKLGC